MSFIGIIANKKDFLNIKKYFSKKIKADFIEIEENNIENIKNVFFDSIVILNTIAKSKQKYLEKICDNANYLIINSDIELKLGENNKKKIITFGMNQLATVTISSVTEDRVLIAQQRNIINSKNKVIEVKEKAVNSKVKNNSKIYNILIKYIIENIYYIK